MKPSVPINTRNQSNNFIAAHTAQVNNHCNSPVSRVGQSGAHQKSNSPCQLSKNKILVATQPQLEINQQANHSHPNHQLHVAQANHSQTRKYNWAQPYTNFALKKQPNPREQEHPQNPPSNHLSTHQHNPSTYTVDFPSRTQNLASRRNLANLTITHIAQQANPHKEVPKKVNKCKQHTVWFQKAPTSPKPYTVHLMHYTLKESIHPKSRKPAQLSKSNHHPQCATVKSHKPTQKGKQIQAGPHQNHNSRKNTPGTTPTVTNTPNTAIMPASTSNHMPNELPKSNQPQVTHPIIRLPTESSTPITISTTQNSLNTSLRKSCIHSKHNHNQTLATSPKHPQAWQIASNPNCHNYACNHPQTIPSLRKYTNTILMSELHNKMSLHRTPTKHSIYKKLQNQNHAIQTHPNLNTINPHNQPTKSTSTPVSYQYPKITSKQPQYSNTCHPPAHFKCSSIQNKQNNLRTHNTSKALNRTNKFSHALSVCPLKRKATVITRGHNLSVKQSPTAYNKIVTIDPTKLSNPSTPTVQIRFRATAQHTTNLHTSTQAVYTNLNSDTSVRNNHTIAKTNTLKDQHNQNNICKRKLLLKQPANPTLYININVNTAVKQNITVSKPTTKSCKQRQYPNLQLTNKASFTVSTHNNPNANQSNTSNKLTNLPFINTYTQHQAINPQLQTTSHNKVRSPQDKTATHDKNNYTKLGAQRAQGKHIKATPNTSPHTTSKQLYNNINQNSKLKETLNLRHPKAPQPNSTRVLIFKQLDYQHSKSKYSPFEMQRIKRNINNSNAFFNILKDKTILKHLSKHLPYNAPSISSPMPPL
eukprot:gene2716-1701_t